MRVLLTGASSSPGYKTLIELARKGFEVFGIYRSHTISYTNDMVHLVRLDLLQYSRTSELFSQVKPDIVIHMAALGNVDQCEMYKEDAWRINVDVTRHLSKLSKKYNSLFLYLSTDYVFSGDEGMYKENSVPYPVNFYGLTKLVAEEIVKSILDRDYIIVRTSAIYGLGPGRKNFGKFLIETLSKGGKVQAIIDQWLSPTLNTLLAKALVELIEKNVSGTYHVAGERISRYEFALKLAEIFGFNKDLIEPAHMSDFNWYAKRPRDSSLDCSKAKEIISIEFNSIEYSLKTLYREWREEMFKS